MKDMKLQDLMADSPPILKPYDEQIKEMTPQTLVRELEIKQVELVLLQQEIVKRMKG